MASLMAATATTPCADVRHSARQVMETYRVEFSAAQRCVSAQRLFVCAIQTPRKNVHCCGGGEVEGVHVRRSGIHLHTPSKGYADSPGYSTGRKLGEGTSKATSGVTHVNSFRGLASKSLEVATSQ